MGYALEPASKHWSIGRSLPFSISKALHEPTTTCDFLDGSFGIPLLGMTVAALHDIPTMEINSNSLNYFYVYCVSLCDIEGYTTYARA